ncbi:MAG: peptidylprolyl isomerase [Phycisphaerae bacterium]|nr:peptidylprolyl isomerase [Phycisphaerae bacterium]
MKNLVLIAAMLAMLCLANGCGSDKKVIAEQSAETPETEAMASEEADVPVAAAAEEVETAVAEAPAQDTSQPEMEIEVAVEETKAAVAEPETKTTVAEIAPEPATESEQPAKVVTETAEAVDPDAAAVTVNGQKITVGQVQDELAKRIEVMKKRMPAGQEMPEAQVNQIHMRLTDSLVDQALYAQMADEAGIKVSEEQVTDQIKEIAARKNQSMEEVEKEITTQYGMTMEDLKGQIHTQMLVKELVDTKAEVTVTEADAKKFYDDNPRHFEQKEQVKASHILCGKRGITEEEYPAEMEKIKAARARLDAGEAFEDVAKDVSTCPSSAQSGDLGFFGRGRMDPAFETAAFGLEVGQTSDIVKTSFGYHIIKVTDKKAAGKTPFAEVQEKITEYLENSQKKEKWEEIEKAFRNKSEIVYFDEEKALRDEAEKARAAQQAAMQQRMAAQREKAQQADETKAADGEE